MLGPFSAESVTVNAKKLLEGFKNLLKTNQWLARYGDNEELDVTFTQPNAVDGLTKNFAKLFGKDVIKNVRGVYEIPGVDLLRKAFAWMTLGNAQVPSTTGK